MRNISFSMSTEAVRDHSKTVTRRVVLFSGGIASWAAARRTVDRYGVEGITLLFTDTLTEDEDLYRFLKEAAADIGAPFVTIQDGRDIWQIFKDEFFLGNSRADPCSRILKRGMSRSWLDANAPDAVVVMGYDWTEIHRHERAQAAWAPRLVESPLIESPDQTRANWIAELEARGIRPPRLYGLGFAHNNCGGGCVKAGVSHFAQLLRVLPDRYAEWERKEEEVRQHIGKDVSILRDRADGASKPMTLADLRSRIEAGVSMPLWDVGGCACFEEPEA